jgi:PAS domain S-box-containing protein
MKPQGESKGDSLRKRAEKILSQKPQDLRKTPIEDIKRLIHELDMYQIELDMQNDELRRAQADIELSVAKYIDLYDFAPVGYLTMSAKGLILEANLTAATLLGLARGTLIKQPLGPFIFKENQGIYYRHLKQLFETGEPQMCEPRMVKKDGTPFWAHLTAVTAQDENGVPVCRIVISDITERKQMERALRENEHRFRSLVETTSDWVWGVDEHGYYTYASPKVKELLGYDPEEVIGKKPFDFMPLDEAERTRKLFMDIAKSRESFSRLENTNLHKDGHPVVLETSGVPIFENDGNFTGYRGIDRDITERKRVEEERENLIRTLEDSLAKIRRLHGLLPICASCKKIRNDKGYWEQLEAYIEEHSEAEITHGFCPDCMKKLYGVSLGEDGKVKEE